MASLVCANGDRDESVLLTLLQAVREIVKGLAAFASREYERLASDAMRPPREGSQR